MKRILALGVLSLYCSVEAMNSSDKSNQKNEAKNKIEVYQERTNSKKTNYTVLHDLFKQPENIYKVRKQNTVPNFPIHLLIKLKKRASSLPEQISFQNLPLIILPEDNPASSSDVPALTYEEKRPVVRELQELKSFLIGLLGNKIVNGYKSAVKTKKASSTSALWQKRIASVSEHLLLKEKLTNTFEILKIDTANKLAELDNEYYKKMDKNKSIANEISFLSSIAKLLSMSNLEIIVEQEWISVIDAHKKLQEMSSQNVAFEQAIQKIFKYWKFTLENVRKNYNNEQDFSALSVAQKHLNDASYEIFVADELNTNRLVQHAEGIVSVLNSINENKNSEELGVYIKNIQSEIPELNEIALTWPKVQKNMELFEGSLREALKKLLGTAPDKNSQECDSAICNVIEAMNQAKDTETIFKPIFARKESVEDVIQAIVVRQNKLESETSVLAEDISRLNSFKKNIEKQERNIKDYRRQLNNLICYVDEAINLAQLSDVQLQISINNWVELSTKSHLPVVHYVLAGKFLSGKGWNIHYGRVMDQNSNMDLEEKGEAQTMILSPSNQEHASILIDYFNWIQCMIHDHFRCVSKFVERKTPMPTAEIRVNSDLPSHNWEQAQKIILPEDM